MISRKEQDKTYMRIYNNFAENRNIFNGRALVKGAQTAYDEGRINFGHILSLHAEFGEVIKRSGAKFRYNPADAKHISDALKALEGTASKPPTNTADILPFKPK